MSTNTPIPRTAQIANLIPLIRKGGHFVIVDKEHKRPMWPREDGKVKGWQNRKPNFRIIRDHHRQGQFLFALVPSSLGLLVVDIDTDHKAGVAQLRKAITDSLGEPAFEVSSRSGGLHLYYRSHERLGNSSWKYEGETGGEIRSGSGYVILWDIDTLTAGLENVEDNDAVDAEKWPIEMAHMPAPTNTTTVTHLNNGNGTRPGPKPSEATIRYWLSRISPDSDYETWIKVGMSLHREGYPVALWEEWSSDGEKYENGVCVRKWATFSNDRQKAVGLRWLENLVIENGPKWVMVTSKGKPETRVLENVVAALNHLSETEFSYDMFADQELMNDSPIMDADVVELQGRLQREYQYAPTKEAMYDGVTAICKRNHSFHPVVDYLEGCEENWDRKLRLNTVGATYWGTEDNPLQNATARLLLYGLVARVLCPGSKFDYLPIIHSLKQGTGKSTSCSILGGDWYGQGFSLDQYDPGKITLERTQNVWLVECAEIGGFQLADTEKLKGFVTQNSDSARMAWGRKNIHRKRQFIMVGTTNVSEFLPDTENRRFPILAVKNNVDLVALEHDRDQLFGEAMHDVKTYGMLDHVALPLALWDAAEAYSQRFRIIRHFEAWFDDWIEEQNWPADIVGSHLIKEMPHGVNMREIPPVMNKHGYKAVRKVSGALGSNKVRVWTRE